LGKSERGLELINKAIEKESRNVIFQTFLARAYQPLRDLNKTINIIDKELGLSFLDAALKEYKQELENSK
jgi:hypothetical protein